MKNQQVAAIFQRLGDILEIKGENQFKVNAYRKATRLISDLTEDIEVVWREGRLTKIPGIGKGIAERIGEYLETGEITTYEEAKREIPEGLVDLLNIHDIGPKTLALAFKKLGVRDLQDLKEVVNDGRLAALPGMGEKKTDNIRRGIKLYQASQGRLLLGVALPLVEEIISELEGRKEVLRVLPAGSLRRMKETVGDIDILAAGESGEEIVRFFTQLPHVEEVLAAGKTRGSIITHEGVQVDLRVVEAGSFGAASQYFTGSKAHNIRLREMSKARGLKINEYGVFRGETKVAGAEETEVYQSLGLPWIPPEIREDAGELEAALEGRLPELVELKDIKGDFHVHTRYSDGFSSPADIAKRGQEMGYEYIVLCDHSPLARYAGGLSEERLRERAEEIARVNSRLKGFRLLVGTEVDIRADGSLDYPDSILSEFDVVVAAIHSGFKHNVTERICRAMESPHVDIIAHPTGRLISSREGYVMDIEQVIKTAAQTNTALEINAYHERLDLNDINCRRAKELGVKLAISTDSHALSQLEMMRFGVGVARRAWLGPGDILNTLPLNLIAECGLRIAE
ncbi:MAG: DNA polymerase/3'-5' exonuclease PolX [bacterium]|nr:DNA polymerase/3'-5' exonuclease PolX [bacterium]